MKYYHGTDRYFEKFQFPTQRAYKDFGFGIYLSDSEPHARSVAYWKRGAHVFVYTYQVNITDIKRHFHVREFKSASLEWLKYIIANRTIYLQDTCDLVIGPTADMATHGLIQDFIKNHPYPSLNDYKELKEALMVDKYGNQICIKSQALLDLFNKSRIKEVQFK